MVQKHFAADDLNATPPTIRMVWGMVSDKDRKKILQLLPKDAVFYFCKPSVIRGLDANVLAEESSTFGLTGSTFADVKSGYLQALKDAKPRDLIYVGGSTFVVADLLIYLKESHF